jgi:hypothetical protein
MVQHLRLANIALLARTRAGHLSSVGAFGPVGVLLAFYLGTLLLIGVTAMRVNLAIRPPNWLKGLAGLIPILKHGILKNGCIRHDLLRLSCF